MSKSFRAFTAVLAAMAASMVVVPGEASADATRQNPDGQVQTTPSQGQPTNRKARTVPRGRSIPPSQVMEMPQVMEMLNSDVASTMQSLGAGFALQSIASGIATLVGGKAGPCRGCGTNPDGSVKVCCKDGPP